MDGSVGGRVAEGTGVARGLGGSAGAESELAEFVRVMGMSPSVMVLRLGGSFGGISAPAGSGTACNAATALVPLELALPASSPTDTGAAVHAPSPSPDLPSVLLPSTGDSAPRRSSACLVATVPAMLSLVSSGAAVELALEDRVRPPLGRRPIPEAPPARAWVRVRPAVRLEAELVLAVEKARVRPAAVGMGELVRDGRGEAVGDKGW